MHLVLSGCRELNIEPELNPYAKFTDVKASTVRAPTQPHPSPQHSNILQNVGMLWYNAGA